MIFTAGYPIQASDISQALGESLPSGTSGGESLDERLRQLVEWFMRTASGPAALERFIETAEKMLVAEALRQAKGNQSHAARLLGLPRPTLHAKLQRHGLRRESASE
jgi:DNA-binding NtrC family response regulator